MGLVYPITFMTAELDLPMCSVILDMRDRLEMGWQFEIWDYPR